LFIYLDSFHSMDNATLFQAKWQWRAFLISHIVALLLITLWLIPSIRTAMLGLDACVFHTLNEPLTTHILWLYTWAIASLRPFDIAVGLVLLTFTLRGNWVFKPGQVRIAFFGLITALATLLVLRELFTKAIETAGLQHASPSDVLTYAVHISDYFQAWEHKWELKDRSGASFPGDHASVLLLWGLFMTAFSKKPVQLGITWLLVVLFMTPRLVAGAHWASDDYIGGLAMALLAMAWTVYSPLAYRASTLLLRLTAPALRGAAHIPIIRRMSLFR
jgi:membrane-associated phospholipid phosphatase